MSDPTILVKKNPLTDLSPAQRLAEVKQILTKESRADWAQLIPRYLGDTRQVKGTVVISQNVAPQRTHWRNSMTAPGTTDGTIRQATFRAPADLWAELRKPPPRRTPQKRVESMMRRYLMEVQQGNAAGIDRLGAHVLPLFWKKGMSLTAEGLRALAAASLQEAETKQKARFYKMTTSPWAVK